MAAFLLWRFVFKLFLRRKEFLRCEPSLFYRSIINKTECNNKIKCPSCFFFYGRNLPCCFILVWHKEWDQEMTVYLFPRRLTDTSVRPFIRVPRSKKKKGLRSKEFFSHPKKKIRLVSDCSIFDGKMFHLIEFSGQFFSPQLLIAPYVVVTTKFVGFFSAYDI